MTTIKELRAAQKLSQAAFAKSIGVGLSTIGGYESGRIQPSAKVAAKIKEIYGVVVATAAEAKTEEVKAEKPAARKPAAKAKKAAEKKEEKPAKAAPKAKKAAAKKPVEEKKAEEKPAEEKKETSVIIQSPMGGEIDVMEIIARVGGADKIYVRVDENKAYWVRGEETGSVELW